jgi:predicted Fe-S protein YdhL (DUF1289 family)
LVQDGAEIAFCAAILMFAAESDVMVIKTPCIKLCTVDPTSRLCRGCGRTLDEIGRWSILTDAERGQIMAELPARMNKIDAGAGTAAAFARG